MEKAMPLASRTFVPGVKLAPPQTAAASARVVSFAARYSPLHHRYSDGNRLKIGRQSIRPIDNLPSCDRTVRGGFEPDTLDTLLTAREYHSVSDVILALNQTDEMVSDADAPLAANTSRRSAKLSA